MSRFLLSDSSRYFLEHCKSSKTFRWLEYSRIPDWPGEDSDISARYLLLYGRSRLLFHKPLLSILYRMHCRTGNVGAGPRHGVSVGAIERAPSPEVWDNNGLVDSQ